MTKVIGVMAALMLATTGMAQADQQYYSSQLWDVTLHDVGSDDGVMEHKVASCDATSKLWADHQIVFTYTMMNSSEGIFAIFLHKDSWKLQVPKDKSKFPKLTIAGANDAVKYTAEVNGSNSLAIAFPTDNNFVVYADGIRDLLNHRGGGDLGKSLSVQLMLDNLTLLPDKLFDSKGKPSGMAVSFQGNEPVWSYPAENPYDAAALGQALQQCKLTLVNRASQQTSSGGATSPMPDASDDQPNASASEQATSGDRPIEGSAPSGSGAAGSVDGDASSDSEAISSQRINNWRFSQGEEDWGNTCFVQATADDISVGFMGSPGKDIVGYVSGVFHSDTRATWQVDDKTPYVSNGGMNDYFGWVEFGELAPQLVSDVAAGKNGLQIVTTDNKKLNIGLTGATVAITSFNSCFNAKSGATGTAQGAIFNSGGGQ